ncbi:MAG: sigma-54-dependent Fis family transcriptional regulator [Verrucomicrobia bacterium]|nr:sigma-54-dependent Fis family transcriptional regulator [Verrucomicrobiota bacterium]
MHSLPRILLIEDDSAIAESLRQLLSEESFKVTHEARGDRGLSSAQTGDFDVVLSDIKMPGLDGLELVRQLRRVRPRLPIVLMTAHGTTDTAIEATRSGAFDYLLKPFDIEELLQVLEKAVTNSRMVATPVVMGEPASARDSIVGSSRVMRELYKEVGRLADKPVTVLIQGETGSGKELVARALWQYSRRASGPFVAINCAAIPITLLESELFGHERGSFTGAEARRIGRFEQAHHGTLFLDEIGDLAPDTQAKLLRVLQESCFERLGGREIISVDVRIIAATHRNLEKGVKDGTFREDLFYRLSVTKLKMPPLRERKEDIAELAGYFLRRYSDEFGLPEPSMQADAIAALQAHDWPGNVRELQNTLRKVLLACNGYPIFRDHVERVISPVCAGGSEGERQLSQIVSNLLDEAKAGVGGRCDALSRLVEIAEREFITQAIERAQGNQAQAARWAGVSRITMREKLRQFGLHPGDKRES